MYSNSQLQSVIQERLGQAGRLIIVSNREPFVHEHRDGSIRCSRPAGGVTSALNRLLDGSSGVWVAQGSGSADRDVVDRYSHVMVPPECPRYTLRRVWISEKLRREFYSGLANQALWPLCHTVYRRPRFSSAEWKSYRAVNRIFADAVIEEAAGGPAIVFIQDYHFGLLPRMLKERNRNLSVAHFWHIPWPTPDVFSGFPWKEELLEGLLGNDLLGFQLREHHTNFLHSVSRFSEAVVDSESGRVLSPRNTTTLGHFPIGIDFDRHCAAADSAETAAAMETWKQRIGSGVRLGVGIDRIDYTKGIPERIRALDIFLERHPEWRGKLVFVQVGVPSRMEIAEYRLLADEIGALVAAVNARWGTGSWQPIQFVRENLPAEQMIALHRLAAFCLVTPLHDGMNLVAKEFVASRDDLQGALILSRFAGASGELNSAILVNPFSEDEIAAAIWTALTLSPSDARRRMSRMRASVQSNNIYRWASGILSALVQVARPELPARTRGQAAGVSGLAEVSLI
ncbi:MAG TPA: trehalose-6-phosphate synthase [Bryobacteraceae bacterium]|nr:trehalose-6-phosphate synthase [Bryobacteraceae bacterium]